MEWCILHTTKEKKEFRIDCDMSNINVIPLNFEITDLSQEEVSSLESLFEMFIGRMMFDKRLIYMLEHGISEILNPRWKYYYD